MESRFGESFGDVRIHTGRNAADAAGALDSRAFTVGENIVLAMLSSHPKLSKAGACSPTNWRT